MSSQPDESLEVLRGVWSAKGQGADELDAATARPPKVCKNMVNVGFDGLAEGGGDLRTAWRARLEREGKLNSEAPSIRDLVLGPE